MDVKKIEILKSQYNVDIYRISGKNFIVIYPNGSFFRFALAKTAALMDR